MQDHCHTHTCHNKSSGAFGCRFCILAGHPVNELVMKQLNAADRVPEGAILIGNGQPVWCEQVLGHNDGEMVGSKCTVQWPRFNQQMSDDGNEDDETEAVEVYIDAVITQPTAAPAFPSGEDTVPSYFFLLLRLLLLSLFLFFSSSSSSSSSPPSFSFFFFLFFFFF